MAAHVRESSPPGPGPQLGRNDSPKTVQEIGSSATITGRFEISRCDRFASVPLKLKLTAHNPHTGSCLERWTSLRVHVPRRTKKTCRDRRSSHVFVQTRMALLYSLYFGRMQPHHDMIRADGIATWTVLSNLEVMLRWPCDCAEVVLCAR
jgi:hypothetical protein